MSNKIKPRQDRRPKRFIPESIEKGASAARRAQQRNTHPDKSDKRTGNPRNWQNTYER